MRLKFRPSPRPTAGKHSILAVGSARNPYPFRPMSGPSTYSAERQISDELTAVRTVHFLELLRLVVARNNSQMRY